MEMKQTPNNWLGVEVETIHNGNCNRNINELVKVMIKHNLTPTDSGVSRTLKKMKSLKMRKRKTKITNSYVNMDWLYYFL